MPVPSRVKDMIHHQVCPDPHTPAITLRPRQAALALGISLSTLERLTKAGESPVVRNRSDRLYLVEALKDWVRTKGGQS
jgi:excisionase family DNA binding protein